jgi:hypothetical protein
VARRSFMPVMAVFLAIGTIALIQYIQTGHAFSFLYVQTSGTDKHWHGLNFPLTTWYQAENLWMDGLAAVTGILVSVILLFTIWEPAEKKQDEKPVVWNTKVVRFSMLYLGIQVWYVIFNAQVHEPSGSTSIMSLGRYVFCTPFWMIFALAVYKRPKWNTTTLVITMFLIFLVICLMGVKAYFSDNVFWAQFDEPALLYHVCMLLLTLPLFFANRPRVSMYFMIAGYLVGVFMQLVLYDAFTGGIWVG